MELKLNIIPPDGYDVIRIGIPTAGELFVDLSTIGIDGKVSGSIIKADIYDVYTLKLILRKKKQKKEIIIFESTGEFREPKENEYFKVYDEYSAIGYKPNHNVILGNKEIFKRISNHTYED